MADDTLETRAHAGAKQTPEPAGTSEAAPAVIKPGEADLRFQHLIRNMVVARQGARRGDG
jgi:hypothetical protein